MKTRLFILLFLTINTVNAQKYYWDFAVSTSNCPNSAPVYYTPIDIYTNLCAVPIDMALDVEGNMYVLGNYLISEYDRNLSINQFSPSKKTINLKHEISNISATAIYLYKINKFGEVVWANTLSSGPNDNLIRFNSNVKLSVNPYSGQVYIVTHFTPGMFMNAYDIIDLYPKALPRTPQRMMLCFNANGSFDKVILSPGILEKPYFSSATSGAFQMSRFAYNGFDSISLYHLNCTDNTLDNYISFQYYYLIGFDQLKQRYITDRFAELDTNLNTVVFDRYSHQYTPTNIITNYLRTKDGSIYLEYLKENPNSNNNETKYYLVKMDKSLKLKWRFQDFTGSAKIAKDTNDNVFLFANTTFSRKYGLISSGSLIDYPAPNPSNFTHLNIYKLDTSNGQVLDIVLSPTNYYQPGYLDNVIKIDNENQIWISSGFIDEMEIGNFTLNSNCGSKNLPIQHFVAKAGFNWQSNRKNLSIDELNNSDILSVHPNPSCNTININTALEIQDFNIEIIDMFGKKHSPNCIESTIDISNLSSGLYTLLLSNHQNTYTCQFIKY